MPETRSRQRKVPLPRINVEFQVEDYEKIVALAAAKNMKNATLVREYVLQGLAGELTQQNMDLINSSLAQIFKAEFKPYMERIAAMTAKSSLQSLTSSFLAAEALASFLPEEDQADFNEALELARKRATYYLRNKESDLDDL